ncbi:MAG: 4-alpha-glucanotransferase [Oscillospiraceae bacterium]|nr:4-alpha-glucanotransferase [Oscillospiraceae bacterium]
MRTSGVLLHITSLPGKYGTGTLGRYAYEFVDFLKETGQYYWQILPIGPTGYGDSPYQCYSAFAGNPVLIDLEGLIDEGLLESDDLDLCILEKKDFADFSQLFSYKRIVLAKAYGAFLKKCDPKQNAAFEGFCSENASWLDDYALFMTVKAHFDQEMWTLWDDAYRLREPGTLKKFSEEHKDEIGLWKFMQFKFFEQYLALKSYANRRGIHIYGDMPIYVSMDSSDIWAHPEMFMLDADRRPVKVAGCPPDPFSPTGQLWGNPVYDWDYLEKHDFSWWVERVRCASALFDITRIDHFRGFEGFYAIPAENDTAEEGEWLKGPGIKLFETIKQELGDVALVAEDLGFLTEDVHILLEKAGYPGMKVLEFAFGGDDSSYLPHNHPKNSAVYIGTHDNDTLLGWYTACDEKTKKQIKKYFGLPKKADEKKVCKAFLRALFGSHADIAVVQMQDILGLGSEARMNTPSTIGGNWHWRMDRMPGRSERKKLKKLTKTYFRKQSK